MRDYVDTRPFGAKPSLGVRVMSCAGCGPSVRAPLWVRREIVEVTPRAASPIAA
jgi:hypothetical protein